MTKRYNSPSGVPLAGYALLAAMLFYVSGAVWLVHIELDHAHGPPQKNAPDDAPKTPTKTHCPQCDLLAGSTHPMAVAAPGQTMWFADACAWVPIPADSPAGRLSAPDISLRGPPSLG